ncbi:MAG: cysteine hydrolase [Firmicutes bacterium]|nr:cysteine hydrolase [Bacillota bacterium]
MTKRALLVIDMLNDFILPEGSLSVGPAGEAIVPLIAQQIKEFREAGEPVIYICDHHRAEDPEFEMFPPHCVQGTPGAEIVEALAPVEGELVIFKRRYSAFFATQLDLCLREMGIVELLLVGVCTNICVLYTACDARMRTYDVTVLKDAVASFDEEAHDFALAQMENVLGVEVK